MTTGCTKCDEVQKEKGDKTAMCPNCELAMAEHELRHAQQWVIELQKKIGNKIAAMSFWDQESSRAMSIVEEFKEKENDSSK